MLKRLKLFFKTLFRTIRFNLSAQNSPLFLGYYRYFYRPKAGTLEAFFDAYSRSKPEGLTVVQIGANDGITNDPIHKFIKRDGWKGVLLEPQPFVYERFLKKIYAKHEGLHTLCAALGPEDTSMPLYKIGFSNMRWATGLASFNRENVERAYTSGLVQKKAAKFNLTLPPPEEQITTEDVQVISSQTLLATYQIETIDLLQVDVEGYDYEVIKLFEVGKTQPHTIVFEHLHLSASDQTACHTLLTQAGYSLREFGGNTLAMKSPSAEFEPYFSR